MSLNSPSNQKSSVGIKEIAEDLGLSAGTVSRALNNRQGVNPGTRERVLIEARRRGYVPNQAARQLKEHPALSIGLLFAPFYSSNREISPTALLFVDLLRQNVEQAGMALQVIFFSAQEELKTQIEAKHIDVVIFYGEFPAHAYERIHAMGTPSIVLHHHTECDDQVAVIIDTCQAGYRAVEYLAAMGHERLGLVTGPRGAMHADGIWKGFQQACEEFYLPIEPRWMIALGAAAANKEGAAEALMPIMQADLRPTALFFASDWMALGGYKVARELGLTVPGDVSIVGYDNLPISSELSPPLTTFDVNLHRQADMLTTLATDLVNRRWVEPTSGKREVLFVPDLVKRESCRSLRRAIASCT